ncbi:uncharacterized protein LOC141909068 isoform X2 [Tubulanus polymorphus]
MFKQFTEKVVRQVAADKCKAINGKLAEIRSWDEQRFVGELSRSSSKSYIGFHRIDFDTSPTFIWNDGDVFTNWGPGGEVAPAVAAAEKYCTAINNDGSWKVVECAQTAHPFICSKKN